MIGRIRLPAIITVAVFLGAGGALAQSIGPDEMITPDGAVSQNLALTTAQRNAIYNAATRARVRSSGTTVPVAIGATVPPSVDLRELPDQASAENPLAEHLKYTVVADDIVVVDPIRMRVVDIIHARP